MRSYTAKPVNETDKFFSAAFSVDLALFTFHDDRLKLLLIEKEEEPYQGNIGLPGRLIKFDEDTEQALNQVATEIIGTENFYRKQLQAMTEVGRHPSGRVITIAYYGLIPYADLKNNSLKKQRWIDLKDLPELTYDHGHIVKLAMNRFRKGLLRHPNVFKLLPEEFILSELIEIYEQAFDKELDKPNFRRQIKESNLIKETGKYRIAERQMGRPPQLYTFDRRGYAGKSHELIGFNF